MNNNFAYSGHFGDVYIVICKLNHYRISNNIEKVSLTRITYEVESPFDKQILSLVSSFDWIDFLNIQTRLNPKDN